VGNVHVRTVDFPLDEDLERAGAAFLSKLNLENQVLIRPVK
jgi:hypothetical protein